MWINETIAKNATTNDTHIGVVTDIADGLVTVNSHTRIANVQVISGFGLSAMPQIGQEVLVMSTKTGEFICIGDASRKAAVMEDEIVISSSGGGNITLKSDGSVVMNGLTITKSGQIIPKAT